MGQTGKIVAQKMGSVQKAKASLKKGGVAGGGIQSVPTDGITVRFLTEPDEWVGYYEYFDQGENSFYPMVEGEVLPKGVKPSQRYLTSALVVSDGPNSNKVIPLKLAKTCAISVMAKYDKYGTLLDRDFELARIGEGFDTSYDVTPESPVKRNLSKHKPLDLISVLIKARGDEDDADDEDEVEDDETAAKAPAAKKAAASKKAPAKRGPTRAGKPKPEPEPEPEDEGQDAEWWAEMTELAEKADAGSVRAANKIKSALAELDSEIDPDEIDTWAEVIELLQSEQGYEPSDDEDEPVEDEPTEDDEDVLEVDEETLMAMSVAELREIADEYGVEHKGLAKSRLVQAIIDAAEE